MHDLTRVWLVGCLATAATAASTVFNAILAVNNTSNERLNAVLRILLFVGLGFSFLDVLSLVYFTVFFVRNVRSQFLHDKKIIWSSLGFGIGVGFIASVLSLLTLIWLTVQRPKLPALILGRLPIVWLAAWYGCAGLAILSQLALYIIHGLWTRQKFKTRSVGRLDIDSGTRLPPTPPQEMVQDESRSAYSQQPTFVEPPRTPSITRLELSRPDSTKRFSSSSNGLASTSKTRLVGPPRSAKSSLDNPFPAGEAMSLDNAFDRWDTSSVHFEMRAAVGSTHLVRTGLETIPGSRPESPEEPVDGPRLPSSPRVASSSPQAITSDRATTLGDWSSSPSRYVPTSSPPSSPPNFSRPTSKQKNQPLGVAFEVEPAVQETIHPLFRASSPRPPPIATSGTNITASPMANQPITPRTLANLRTHNKSSSAVNSQYSKPTGHWRAMPSVSQMSERRPSTSGSHGPGSPPPGSPGPSIADEEELPPILPGFVLSAGQRTSMLGYANRKSVRTKRGSQMSGGW